MSTTLEAAAYDGDRTIEEPYVKATIISPPDYVGAIMDIRRAAAGRSITWSTCTTAASSSRMRCRSSK